MNKFIKNMFGSKLSDSKLFIKNNDIDLKEIVNNENFKKNNFIIFSIIVCLCLVLYIWGIFYYL